jgi:hypothetical protein
MRACLASATQLAPWVQFEHSVTFDSIATGSSMHPDALLSCASAELGLPLQRDPPLLPQCFRVLASPRKRLHLDLQDVCFFAHTLIEEPRVNRGCRPASPSCLPFMPIPTPPSNAATAKTHPKPDPTNAITDSSLLDEQCRLRQLPATQCRNVLVGSRVLQPMPAAAVVQ